MRIVNESGLLDDDEKSNITGSKVGSDSSKLRIVNESGLYDLIFKSRKPDAKKFRKWVTSEVLPQIRMTDLPGHLRVYGPGDQFWCSAVQCQQTATPMAPTPSMQAFRF